MDAGGGGGGSKLIDVTMVLLDDGPSSTGVVPVEIFHYAGVLWNDLNGRAVAPAFRVKTVSLDGKSVVSPQGFEIKPEGALADVEHTDIAIVMTSGLELDVHLVENSALLPWLRKHYAAGAHLVGICMGAAYLAEAGLLDGRLGTTHWALSEDFARRYPKVNWRTDLFVTEDSRLLCSGGLYACIDLSLYLVEKICGHEVAVQTAKALLLPMPRKHQTGYSMLPLSPSHGDERVRAVETFLQGNYKEDISTEALARQAGLGARTLARRFKAATGRHPAAYLQAVRIETAKAMLERDCSAVQSVSSAVGYDDVSFFRNLFKRSTGMTPAEYRSHFAPLSVRGHPTEANVR
jgi:transcriptional regulator GlxA family with amidase domain